MSRRRTRGWGFPIVLAGVLVCGTARADDTGPRVSAGVLAGYGFGVGDFVSNPYGVGIGAWLGVTLTVPYVGGRFVYHTGTSNAENGISSSGTPQGTTTSQHSWLAGIDLGADVLRSVVTIRPLVSVGVLQGTRSLAATASPDVVDQTKTVGYVAPGAMLLLGDKGALGGFDVRYVARLAGGAGSPAVSGLEVLGTVGVGF